MYNYKRIIGRHFVVQALQQRHQIGVPLSASWKHVFEVLSRIKWWIKKIYGGGRKKLTRPAHEKTSDGERNLWIQN